MEPLFQAGTTKSGKSELQAQMQRKEKSGGFRTIYFWQEGCKKVYLLFTYAKSAKVDVNSKEIAKFIEGLLDE